MTFERPRSPLYCTSQSPLPATTPPYPLCPMHDPNTIQVYTFHFNLSITPSRYRPPYPLCPHACPYYPISNTTHVYPFHFIFPNTPFPMPPLHAPYALMRGPFGCSRKERGREIAKLRFLSPSFVFFLMLSGRREEIGGGTTLSLSIFVCLSVSLSLSPQLCLPLVFSHSCSSTLTRQRVKARERKS